MTEEHDKGHRLLFSFPRMIEDLIRLCLGGDWIERLDFSTLEKVPERLLSKELRRREQDVLWRLRYLLPDDDPKAATWFYIYIHLEHQRRPRRWMVLDVMVYKLLALQDLIRSKVPRPGDKLPLILTVVFYNGEARWRAATSFSEILQEVPDLPEDLDFWSYKRRRRAAPGLEELLGKNSPLVGLFRLEQLEDPEELSEVTRELHQWLDPTEDQELAEAFVTLINETVLGKLAPKGGE